MLIAFGTIVKSDARCKELMFFVILTHFLFVGEMRYDRVASVVGKSC